MEQSDVEQLLAAWGAWARDDAGGPRVLNRAGSAEGGYIPKAGELFAADVRPRPMIISDELAMMVDRTVGGVGDRHTEILLRVFVDGLSSAAVGGQLVVDAAVRQVTDRLNGSPERRRRGDHGRGEVWALRLA
jgi:hypothetical protein